MIIRPCNMDSIMLWNKIITIAILVFLCISSIPSHTHALFSEMSIEDERKLGEEFLFEASKQLEFYHDLQVVYYITRLGSSLLKQIKPLNFDYRFYVVKDSSINAFAAPGGHIFVYTGIIKAMENEEELASIICHEIGHVKGRHIAKRIASSQKLNIATLATALAGIFLTRDPKASQAIITGTIATAATLSLKYSREDEEDADRRGLTYLRASGYEGFEMVSAFKKMRKGQWFSAETPFSYLYTHPQLNERMTYLSNTLQTASLPPLNTIEPQYSSFYPYIRARIFANDPDAAKAETYFINQLQKYPDDPATIYGNAMILYRRGKTKEAISIMENLAKDPSAHIIIIQELGSWQRIDGQLDSSLKTMKKAVLMDNTNIISHYMTGMTLEQLDENEEALQAYLSAVYLAPYFADPFKRLGILYAHKNKMALSHYYSGRYFVLINNLKNATYHFTKAEEIGDLNETQTGFILEYMKKIKNSRYKPAQ